MIDYDGVIHDQNDGWRDGAVYGPPIPGAIEELQNRIAGGWSIAVVTARHHDLHHDVARWLEKHAGLETVVCEKRHAYWHGPKVLVTNVKCGALAYIDDNAIHFNPRNGGWSTALAALPYSPDDVLTIGGRE
ncbi:hypothetical protein [Streptomyces sp. NRRL B-24484]|uniref:hypothetical protein n=1 Tax=Streptomyces sp. NRRL B-24484 TaxID=1463833 RepID=UPI0004BE5A57|nr:hypothetical protein [Streptomyces sp. NRRL B-24484]